MKRALFLLPLLLMLLMQPVFAAGPPPTVVSDLITKGPWVDVRSSTLSTAANYAIAHSKPLHITTQVNITSNTDLSAVPEIDIVQGGKFNISSGATLTLPLNFHAAASQVFLGSGFVAGLKESNPIWFGAKGDGVTNDTAAFQSAINSLLPYGKFTLPTPADSYLVDQINISTIGLHLSGSGKVEITPSDTLGASIFQVAPGTHDVVFDGLNLDGTGRKYFTDPVWGVGVIQVGIGTAATDAVATNNIKIINCNVVGPIVGYTLNAATITGNRVTDGIIRLITSSTKCNIANNTVSNTVIPLNACIEISDVSSMGGASKDNSIANNVTDGYGGITVYGPQNSDSIVSGNVVRITIFDADAIGISIAAASNIVVSNNSVTAYAFHDSPGIELAGASAATVSGNYVKNFGQGVMINGSDLSAVLTQATVIGNTLVECKAGVMVFRYVDGVVISGNNITYSGATYNGITGNYMPLDRYPRNVTISGNTIKFTGEGSSYLLVASFSDSVVTGNSFSWNSTTSNPTGVHTAGDSTGNIEGVRITGNTFYSVTAGIGYGVSVSSSTGRNIKITDNDFKNLFQGIYASGSQPLYDILVSNNTSYNTNSSLVLNSQYSQIMGTLKIAARDSAAPTAGTWYKGSIIYNSQGNAGWECTQSGTMGTLTGVTGTSTAGSADIVLNTSVGIEAGQRITVAGAFSGSRQIIRFNAATNTATMDSTSTSSVTDGAVAYSNAIFAGISL